MAGPYFTPALFSFLIDLGENNDRAWFDAHRERYERDLKEPALRFIRDFGEPLRGISPHFEAVPKAVGGSLFRIFRDTRFSADKRPYKTNTGLHFRHVSAKDAHAPGFYLHLAPGEVFGGFGLWEPDPPTLARLRDAIVAQPDRWAAIKAELDLSGMPCAMADGMLKRVPPGYPKDHPHAEDLKRKSHAASVRFTEADATAPDFLERYAAACRRAAPVMAFLCEAVGVPF
jgi:uncharacterized protein (TIGR02453 family)